MASLAGLALDYCVAFTCKDAAKAGFNVHFVKGGARGIAPETVAREIREMQAAGVHIIENELDVPTSDVEEAVAKGIVGGATTVVAGSKLPGQHLDVLAPIAAALS